MKLTAIGGLLALNRTMDVDALRDAAMASTGATGTSATLDAVLFPDRPEQRFLELVPALERFFPADFAPGQYHRDATGSTVPERWPITYEDLAPFYAAA